MKTALVTGGNGFIGSHLVDELIAQSWQVYVIDTQDRRFDSFPQKARFIGRTLSERDLLNDVLSDVDTVFHLAWNSIHETANQNLIEDVKTNLFASINLLESCVQANVKRFVFTSSGGTVYGPTQTVPIPEAHPTLPINAYGVNKLAIEKYLNMFHHLYGLNYTIFRPSVPYGPRQNHLGSQGAVPIFMHRIYKGLPITLWGDGQTTRDFFYITDLTDAMVSVAQLKSVDSAIFNIGGGQEISLLELIEMIEKIVGKKAQIQYQPKRKFDVQRIKLSTEKAKQKFGWTPKISLQVGLKLTWQWMQARLHS